MWRASGGMPTPVEALPCGSRSMIRTFSPTAASAVPRLIAVVVLPTPPFWLAIARIRRLCAPEYLPVTGIALRSRSRSPDGDDAGRRIGQARRHLDIERPVRARLRRLPIPRPAPWETDPGLHHQRMAGSGEAVAPEVPTHARSPHRPAPAYAESRFVLCARYESPQRSRCGGRPPRGTPICADRSRPE